MIELLKQYLLQQSSISIPGLGTVYIERTPAQSDYVNRQLLPPGYHYRFDKYFDTPEKGFFCFLANAKKIEEIEAIRMFNEWARNFRDRITNGGSEISLEGIGSLKRNENGEVVFEPAGKPAAHIPIVAGERVIRINARHSMLVGDKETSNVEMSGYYSDAANRGKTLWWLYLLVAIIVLAAIGLTYYYNTQ